METTIAERYVNHHVLLLHNCNYLSAVLVHCLVEKTHPSIELKEECLRALKVKRRFPIYELEHEVRQNIVKAKGEIELRSYLYYLVKNYISLRIKNFILKKYIDQVEEFNTSLESENIIVFPFEDEETISLEIYKEFKGKVAALKQSIKNFENVIILEFGISPWKFSNHFPEIKDSIRIPSIDEFNSYFKIDFSEITSEQKSTKLAWKGQKNQLYSVLRQLKEAELIGNSFNSLADFLIDNVVGFEMTAKETIEKELKKKKALPKNRRVDINLKEEEENMTPPNSTGELT